MSKTRVLIPQKEIREAVSRLAQAIARDYGHSSPVLIGALKGSFIFLADLVRALDIPLEVDFVRVSSYGAGTESSGKIRVVVPLRSPVQGRHVLVVEDIVDTGLTLAFLLDYLKRRGPASLKVCALLDKPARRRVPVNIDYLGFTVPDAFLVGYGLDFNEQLRNLPDVCILEQE